MGFFFCLSLPFRSLPSQKYYSITTATPRCSNASKEQANMAMAYFEKFSLCSLSQSRERIMKKSSKAIFQCIFDLECAITISFAKTRFSKQKNKASKSASSTQFVEKCAIHRPSTKKRPWIGACGCAPFSKLQFQFRTQKGVSISIFLFSRGSAPTGIVWG